MQASNRFGRGSPVYACRCCGRNTRQTGRGDNENVNLCANCFDLAGEENSLSDTGDFYESPAYVLQLIEGVAKLGGNAACWRDLKAAAQKAVAAS